jgi:hypothetical protein
MTRAIQSLFSWRSYPVSGPMKVRESMLAEDVAPVSHKVVFGVYPVSLYRVSESMGKSTEPRYDGNLQRVCGYNRRASQTQEPEQGSCTRMLFCFWGWSSN